MLTEYLFTDEDRRSIRKQAEHLLANAEEKKYGPGHGDPARSNAKELADKCYGCAGEMTWARIHGYRFPHPCNDFGNADFPFNVEVRGTVYKSGRLFVFDRDPDHKRFVLVVVNGLGGRIKGWATKADAWEHGFRPGPDQVTATSAPQMWLDQKYLKTLASFPWSTAEPQ